MCRLAIGATFSRLLQPRSMRRDTKNYQVICHCRLMPLGRRRAVADCARERPRLQVARSAGGNKADPRDPGTQIATAFQWQLTRSGTSELPGSDCAGGGPKERRLFRPDQPTCLGDLAPATARSSWSWVLPGRWPPLPAHRAACGVAAPCPAARTPHAGCCPAGGPDRARHRPVAGGGARAGGGCDSARLPHARAIGTWTWYGWPSPALSPSWPGRAVAPAPVACRAATGRDPVAILRSVSCGSGVEDTEGVNRERAETYLRLVAEAELRRATTPPRDGAAMPPDMPGAERRPVVLRRSDVAAALYDLPRPAARGARAAVLREPVRGRDRGRAAHQSRCCPQPHRSRDVRAAGRPADRHLLPGGPGRAGH